MLTEREYLDITDRVERLTMGDRTITGEQILIDMIRLLTDWREMERRLKKTGQGDASDQQADHERDHAHHDEHDRDDQDK